MKEFRSYQPRAAINRLSRDELLVELYRLACYFHASPSMSSNENDIHLIPVLDKLIDDVQENEIVKVLLTSAIQIRLLDEQLWDKPKDIKDMFEVDCGFLWFPDDISQPEKLSLREACNKIVHNTDIGYIVDEEKFDLHTKFVPRFLTPKITTYGTKNKKGWKAEINIDAYIEGAYYLACYT